MTHPTGFSLTTMFFFPPVHNFFRIEIAVPRRFSQVGTHPFSGSKRSTDWIPTEGIAKRRFCQNPAHESENNQKWCTAWGGGEGKDEIGKSVFLATRLIFFFFYPRMTQHHTPPDYKIQKQLIRLKRVPLRHWPFFPKRPSIPIHI